MDSPPHVHQVTELLWSKLLMVFGPKLKSKGPIGSMTLELSSSVTDQPTHRLP